LLIIYNAKNYPCKAEDLAKHLNISESLVHKTIYKYKKYGVESKEKKGKGGRSYSTETNRVEHIWDDIIDKELHNKYFKNIKNAVDAVCDGLNRLNANQEYLKSLTNFPHLNITY